MVKNRRGAKGAKKQYPALLVACQGTVTEPAYLDMLKTHFRAPAITIWAKAKDPVKLVQEVSQKVNKEDFDRAFVLIDVDDSPADQIQQAISLSRKSKRPIELIVSNECFEVWLLAHFRRVDNGLGRSQLTDRLISAGAVLPKNPKVLASDFPIEGFDKAVDNVDTVDPNTLGPQGSTAMRAVVKELQRRSQRQARSSR